MRTGAIFARGSCRALKWMALVGMVFALGAVSAVAQTLQLSSTNEGSTPEATVTLATAIPADGTAIVFTLTAAEYDGVVPVVTGRNAFEAGSLVSDVGVELNSSPTITVAAGERTGTLLAALTFANDDDAEDEYFRLVATGNNSPATVINLDVIVRDSRDQEYELTLPSAAGGAITEGAGAATLTLEADPPRSADIPVALELRAADRTKYTLGDVMNSADPVAVTTMFGMGDNNPVTASIEAMADGNRRDDRITVTAYTGTLGDREVLQTLEITVNDANPLPIVDAIVVGDDEMALDEQPNSIEEGETIMVRLTVVDEDGDATASAEDLSIRLRQTGTAEAGDYRLGMNPVEIAEGQMSSAIFELEARPDGEFDPGETLVFDAVVSGDSTIGPGTETSSGVVNLSITDRTPLTVTTKSQADIDRAYMEAREVADGADELWTTRDGSLMIHLNRLFNLPETGGYDADAVPADPTIVDADADADPSATGGGMVVVIPEGPGMTEVTVTVSTRTSSATMQTSATSAQVVFEAMVDGIPVTAKTQAEIDAAYMAARNAAAGADGYWTTGDGPATIPLSALFNDLPSDATASVMSSMTDYVLASTTGSDIVLNPQGVGTSTVTVTVAGADKPASFMATVVAPRMDTRGSITAFSIAGTEEKTVDGVKRMHLTEGGITTATVTVTWTNQQLTALWAGHTAANPPPPARINLYDTAFVADAAVGRWLSLAETSERDGTGSRGGNDVVWGSRDVEVKIPAKPKTTASPAGTDTGTGTTSVSLPNDDDAEPEAFRVSWWPAQSQGVKYVGALQNNLLTATTHVIEDDEPQGIKLTKAMKDPIYEGGGTVKFSAVADPRREDLPLEVRYTLSDSSGVSVSSRTYTLDNSTGTIPVGPAGKDEVVLNVARNDGDRMDDMLQMHAEVVAYALDTGAYGDVGSKMVDFTVIDVHKLPPVTVMPETATLMEGKQLELTVTVDRNPRETRAVDPETLPYTTEELSIAVMASGATGEYSLSSTAITVPEYKHKAGTTNWLQPVKVTVEALMDEDVEPDSMLMLDFVVNGTVAANGPSDSDVDGQASVTIQDATATLVSVRDNAYDVIQGELGTPPTLTTGMSGELTGANLFDYDPSAVSVAYATSVDGAAVTTSASGGTVTIMAVSAGEAKVTITATATPNGSSLVVNQTKSNVAQLTFPVMVEDPPLTFTVMGPDDMNLIEGGMGGMVKVMTNRAVSENTEVMLMRDGSSSAGEDDYELDPPLVTIMAGQNEGHTMVMALADDMMENADNMPEMLTLFLVVDGMQMSDQSVSFYIWDAAVPALPVIAQLLLAALLGLGGYRRYLRRR